MNNQKIMKIKNQIKALILLSHTNQMVETASKFEIRLFMRQIRPNNKNYSDYSCMGLTWWKISKYGWKYWKSKEISKFLFLFDIFIILVLAPWWKLLKIIKFLIASSLKFHGKLELQKYWKVKRFLFLWIN